MLFAGSPPGAGSHTPSAAFSHLSLSTPAALPSPVLTPAPFPPLMLNNKYRKDEHVAKHNLLRTRIQELEQRLHMESMSKALLKQSLEATVMEPKGGFDRAIAGVQSDLERKIEELRKVGEGSERSDSSQSSSDDKSGVEAVKEEPEMDSKTAVGHSSIKSLTKQTFYLFLGTMNLKTKSNFPAYKTGELGFIQGSTETRQLWLNWEATAKHVDNVNKLAAMARYARQAGPNIVAEAKRFLPFISKTDLLNRFQGQFDNLQQIHKGTSGRGRAASGTQVPEVEGFNAPLNNTKFSN
ncbi:hypothetical protein AAF712_010706 [Marasmius tenuissimus]|uniref:Uncharacterized protein n=1 Tax=Marasmius tenuissimus TaxID=585030 RepID=A0ABR2ZPW2_9AGAR